MIHKTKQKHFDDESSLCPEVTSSTQLLVLDEEEEEQLLEVDVQLTAMYTADTDEEVGYRYRGPSKNYISSSKLLSRKKCANTLRNFVQQNKIFTIVR